MNAISIWKHFAKFAYKRLIDRKAISFIDEIEELGRGVFSRKSITEDRVKPNAFMQNNAPGFSVHRLTFAPKEVFIYLAKRHAKRRNRNFYGFGRILATDAKSIYSEVIGVWTIENPFHAECRYPPDAGPDMILDLARRCSNVAKPDLYSG